MPRPESGQNAWRSGRSARVRLPPPYRGRDAGEFHAVQGDAGGIDQGAFPEAHLFGQLLDALDRIDAVLRVGARVMKPVVAVSALGTPVVGADRIAPGQTALIPAMAATFMGFTGHAVSRSKADRIRPDADDLTRPFMPGGKWIGWRPDSGKTATDDFGSLPQIATARILHSTSAGPGTGTGTC